MQPPRILVPLVLSLMTLAGSARALDVWTVRWESGAFVGPVTIELATGYGDSPAWQTLVDVTANDGSEVVTLPAVEDGSCRIRVSEAADGEPTDLSDAEFAIGDAIVVLDPDGGETWTVGQSAAITWSSSGVTEVHIELSCDAGETWRTLAASVLAADGSFTVTVTNPASTRCLVRITDAADSDPEGVSAAVFTITEPAPDQGQAEDDKDCGCRVATPLRQPQSFAWLALGVLSGMRFRRRQQPATRTGDNGYR